MVQSWEIVNLDKRQALDTETRLWEILVNGAAEGLADLLQVPQIRRLSFSNFDVKDAKTKWYVRLS